MFLTTTNTTLDNFSFSLTCHQWYTLQEGHSLDKAVSLTWGYPVGTDDHSRLKTEFEKWRSRETESK